MDTLTIWAFHNFNAITTMMPNRWRSLPLLLLVNSAFASSQSFENSAIVRSIELGGAAVHVTTTYAIKPLEAGLKSYSIALGREEKKKTGWLEVKSKGEVNALQITERPFDASKYVVPDPGLLDSNL